MKNKHTNQAKSQTGTLRPTQRKYLALRRDKPVSKSDLRKWNQSEDFATQKEMSRAAIEEFSKGGRYRNVQAVTDRRQGSIAFGPQVYIPPQNELPRGALVWVRDYKSPVDPKILVDTMDSADKNMSGKEGTPAHLLMVYAKNIDKLNRFEIYQMEDVGDHMKGQAVSRGLRLIEAKKQRREAKIGKVDEALPSLTPIMSPALRNDAHTDLDVVKRDLIERKMFLQPGHRWGATFIARKNLERDPITRAKITHSEATVAVVPDETPYWSILGNARLGKQFGKVWTMAVPNRGVPDHEDKVRYIGISRLGGGRQTPLNHGTVRDRLSRASIPYRKGWWIEASKDEQVKYETQNLYFPGPSDFHIWNKHKNPKEASAGTWAQFHYLSSSERQSIHKKKKGSSFKGRNGK